MSVYKFVDMTDVVISIGGVPVPGARSVAIDYGQTKPSRPPVELSLRSGAVWYVARVRPKNCREATKIRRHRQQQRKWTVQILESTGTAFAEFERLIEEGDREVMLALAGPT